MALYFSQPRLSRRPFSEVGIFLGFFFKLVDFSDLLRILARIREFYDKGVKISATSASNPKGPVSGSEMRIKMR
jgi:hypothetical protein